MFIDTPTEALIAAAAGLAGFLACNYLVAQLAEHVLAACGGIGDVLEDVPVLDDLAVLDFEEVHPGVALGVV